MTRKSKKQIQNQSQTGYMQNNELQTVRGEAGKQNRIKTHSQSGRSMVEMLGVLAIIAILSIGGIVGFRLAMNYYQANQIAHEMNIMRTDAQIKIAQGAEELMLGEPYDPVNDSLGHIQFNDAYLVDFDCIYMKTEISEPEPAFCTAANAYYIELQEIPEGVCRPLANLIDNMDNEIAFYINGNSVDAEEGEKGACNAEFNTLRVIFGADSDSNAIKCGGADDLKCPDNLPVCLNHMCVECETYQDCQGETPQCDTNTNTCKSCAEISPEKPLWADTQCVECIDSEDCENPTTPYCNPTSNRCEPCENDSQCDTTQKEYCKISTGECVVCEDGSEWDTETEECMNCTERECTDNDDCCENYFCRKGLAPILDTNDAKSAHSNPTGMCEPLGEVKHIEKPNGPTFYAPDIFLVWWDACRWCEAFHGESGSQCDNNTYEPLTMVDIDDIDWQCGEETFPDLKNTTQMVNAYCCANGVQDRLCDTDSTSPTIEWLRTLYSSTNVYVWFKNNVRNGLVLYANLSVGGAANNGARYDVRNEGRARTICK